jgi:hypothetical protein
MVPLFAFQDSRHGFAAYLQSASISACFAFFSSSLAFAARSGRDMTCFMVKKGWS